MNALHVLFARCDDPAAIADDEIEPLREELRRYGQQVIGGTLEVDDPLGTAEQIADYFEGLQYVADTRQARAYDQQAALEERLRLDDAPAPAPAVPALSSISPPASHAPTTRVRVGEPRIMRAIDYRDGDEITRTRSSPTSSGR